MKLTNSIVFLLLFLFFNCKTNTENTNKNQTNIQARWTRQSSHTQSSLRGLSIVNDSIAWASGSNGTFCRTVNGGSTWTSGIVSGAGTLDFRDIEAFDAENAILLSAGQPARIYKTSNGGKAWHLQYENLLEGVFFDAMEFWDPTHGIAMSDPVNGNFIIVTTSDSGQTWQQIPPENIPAAIPGEAGFAASGSNLAVLGKQKAWFGTGGTTARVFRSNDKGLHWEVSKTPMISGEASTGIFSITFCDENNGVAVGGDYLKPEAKYKNAIYSKDGGVTWFLSDGSGPVGYRSCIACVPNLNTLISVGITGSDYSVNKGITWYELDTVGFNAIDFAPSGKQVGWAVGAEGKISKIELMEN